MVTFSHLDSGTDPTLWATAFADSPPRTLDLAPLQRLVVVAAHPDDESLGAGGLITLAARSGIDIDIIIATNGEGSHPHSTTHTPERLAVVRQAEVKRAILGMAPKAAVHLLHLPDGALSDHILELTEEIRFHLAAGDRPVTWLVSPWIGDRHPDHHAAGIAAMDAALLRNTFLLQYPIWAWHWGRPDDGALPLARLRQLPLPTAVRTSKHHALQAHRSQVSPLSPAVGDETLLPARLQQFFETDREYFLVADPADLHATSENSGTATRNSEPVGDNSLPESFFDEFYGDQPDPWDFATRWYEERKRALTLASLPRRRFRRAFEPGCSVGVLTAQLAARCDRMIAADIAAQPLREAARRLAGIDTVELRQLAIPQDWPAGKFDLIVLSEVGYYCSSTDLDHLLSLATTSLTEDGVIVACHWRHQVNAYPLGGDEVHRRLRAQPGLALLSEHIEADFLLDVLVRPPVVSVAAAEGLA